MAVIINKLSDGPILVATCEEPVDWHQDANKLLDEIVELRDKIEGSYRYYVVIDLSAAKPGFGDTVIALGALRRANEKRRKDMPATVFVVGSGPLIQIVSQAIGQQQYGEYRVQMHTSLDKALDTIRSEIAAEVPQATK
ncbi:MAG: hypothetical protein JXB07_04725 [Anaerolineae bacterium]|nr:hypothetical protein [Anaerolineae bacterium]